MSVPKLSDSDRRTVAELYYKGMYSQRELSELYQVSRTTIRRAINDLAWYFDATGEYVLHEEGGPDPLPYTGPLVTEVGHPVCHEDDSPPKWLAWGILAVMAATVLVVFLTGLHAALEAVPH